MKEIKQKVTNRVIGYILLATVSYCIFAGLFEGFYGQNDLSMFADAVAGTFLVVFGMWGSIRLLKSPF